MVPVDPYVLSLHLYLEQHAPKDDALLADLVEETHRRTLHPRMIGGPALATLLQILIRLLRAKHVLELGTFTGYTTIQMARANHEVRVTSLEYDQMHARIAQRYVARAHLEQRVEIRIGDALQLVPQLEQSYDLIFLDSDKRDYPTLYAPLASRLQNGGILVADNVLWGGKVCTTSDSTPQTQALRAFNNMVHADPTMSSCIYPIRDGLLIAQKG